MIAPWKKYFVFRKLTCTLLKLLGNIFENQQQQKNQWYISVSYEQYNRVVPMFSKDIIYIPPQNFASFHYIVLSSAFTKRIYLHKYFQNYSLLFNKKLYTFLKILFTKIPFKS